MSYEENVHMNIHDREGDDKHSEHFFAHKKIIDESANSASTFLSRRWISLNRMASSTTYMHILAIMVIIATCTHGRNLFDLRSFVVL